MTSVFEEFFDIDNLHHLQAYAVLRKTGHWPKEFWDEMHRAGVILPPMLLEILLIIVEKIVARYLQEHEVE